MTTLSVKVLNLPCERAARESAQDSNETGGGDLLRKDQPRPDQKEIQRNDDDPSLFRCITGLVRVLGKAIDVAESLSDLVVKASPVTINGFVRTSKYLLAIASREKNSRI